MKETILLRFTQNERDVASKMQLKWNRGNFWNLNKLKDIRFLKFKQKSKKRKLCEFVHSNNMRVTHLWNSSNMKGIRNQNVARFPLYYQAKPNKLLNCLCVTRQKPKGFKIAFALPSNTKKVPKFPLYYYEHQKFQNFLCSTIQKQNNFKVSFVLPR